MVRAEPQRVETYITEDGQCPFDEWLSDLADLTAAARIDARVTRLRLGLFGDWKAVGEGVMELRVDVGPGYRLYFARVGRRVVLLLCAGPKSTQRADIKTAQAFLADYQARTKGV